MTAAQARAAALASVLARKPLHSWLTNSSTHGYGTMRHNDLATTSGGMSGGLGYARFLAKASQ